MGRKEQAAASRAALIEAARSCFTESGYDATTVAEILDRAGMARGALYHYFPDGKREIFTAVFEVINEEFHERRDSVGTLESPIARVRQGIRIFLELCIDDDSPRIALTDAPRLVPGQGVRGTSYALLREQLDQARSANEVRSFDVDAMAMSLYGAVRGAGEFVISATERDAAARIATELLDALIDGLVIVP